MRKMRSVVSLLLTIQIRKESADVVLVFIYDKQILFMIVIPITDLYHI